MPKTQAQKDRELREKYRKLGIVRVGAWIPLSKKSELQAITKLWRDAVKRKFKK